MAAPTNETILKVAQAGIESSYGVGVAATRKLYATIDPSYDRPLGAVADTTGTYHGRRRPVYGRQSIGFAATDVLTYEDAAWWGQFILKGGVAGDADAGTPIAYTYDFLQNVGVDDLKSMTLEFNEKGNPYESTQVMANSFTIRLDGDSNDEPGWMLDVELLGRDWEPTTLTPSLTDRTTEVIIARGTKVFIDDLDGTVGTTQVLGKVISASITGTINRHMKGFLEDVNSYAAGKFGRGDFTVDGQIVMEFDDDDEFLNYRTDPPVGRLIRLQQTGSAIHDAVTKEIDLDMVGYWSSWDDGDRDGNIIATFGIMGFYDATAGYDLSMSVTNGLATLP